MASAHRLLFVAALAASSLPVGRSGNAALLEKCDGGGRSPPPGVLAEHSLLQAKSEHRQTAQPRREDPALAHPDVLRSQAPAGPRDGAGMPFKVAKSAASHLAARVLQGATSRLLPLAKPPAGAWLSGIPERSAELGKAPRTGSGPGMAGEGGEGDATAFEIFVVGLAGASVYVVLVCCFAFIYVKYYRTEAPEEGWPTRPAGMETQPKDTFHFRIFDCDGCCGRDLSICLCGWCCMTIRWADTLSQPKVREEGSVHGFWALLLFATFCHALDEVTVGFSWLVMLIVAVRSRQKLRAVFGLEHSTVCTYCKDCLVWCCCCPCAAVQEAREVEYLPVP
mmetsp:Transcript_27247/g.84831  ORF Transcript_27247/g.84831 Transcript_27247/m.84831 type:complete len:337 (-) Transcript_27247:117-1127(-)